MSLEEPRFTIDEEITVAELDREDRRCDQDLVDLASDDSFPASDPPSYTPNVSIGPPVTVEDIVVTPEPPDGVDQASEDSFPASDAPPFTPITSLGPPYTP
jgi:hypothetical protein